LRQTTKTRMDNLNEHLKDRNIDIRIAVYLSREKDVSRVCGINNKTVFFVLNWWCCRSSVTDKSNLLIYLQITSKVGMISKTKQWKHITAYFHWQFSCTFVYWNKNLTTVHIANIFAPHCSPWSECDNLVHSLVVQVVDISATYCQSNMYVLFHIKQNTPH